MFPLYDSNPTGRTPWVTMILIGANVVVMLWMISLPPAQQVEVIVHRGFTAKRIQQLVDPKVKVEVDLGDPQAPNPAQRALRPIVLPAVQSEILLSFVTMMFLHGGWMHILGNMWFLWIFGNNVEDRLGHIVFALFYFVCGWLALACQWGVNPNSTVPAIGASGAVAGVLGAYAITFPTAKVRTLVFLVFIITIIDLPALVVLGLWILGQVLNGVGALHLGIDGGVAWFAHIGGFFSGLVLMPLLLLGRGETFHEGGHSWEDWLNQ